MRPRSLVLMGLLPVSSTLAACGGHDHLAEYAFPGHTLAYVADAPSLPSLRTGGGGGGASTPAGVLVEAGARTAKEVEARRVRARLDSAATKVAVAERLASAAAERISRHLGTRVVPRSGDPDFLLEVAVREFGLDASGDGGAARLYLRGEATLLDARTGEEIWTTDVRGWDGLTPSVGDTGPVPGDIVAAGALTTVSVDDLVRSLEGVADASASAILDRFRDDLRDARRR